MKLSSLQSLCMGSLRGDDIDFDAVSIDTRTLQKGELFFALTGEHSDGHQFLPIAIEKGASGLVVKRPLKNCTIPQLVVDDVYAALGCAGKINREDFSGIVVGVTGSNGKTTVKGMLKSILSEVGNTLATEANFNNHIGVPLTLLRITKRHDFAVVESGTSAPGEIAYLTGLVQPNIALVNNVMAAHLQGFGTEQAIANEKAEIYASSSLRAGVVNLQDPYVDTYLEKLEPVQKYGFFVADKAEQIADLMRCFASKVNCAVAVVVKQKDSFNRYSFGLYWQKEKVSITLLTPGKHNVFNAAAAATCALAAGIELDDIVAGLSAFSGVPGRMQFANTTSCKLLVNDTYNANPGSMRAAIDFLTSNKNSVLIAGEMGELGEMEIDSHRDVGAYAKSAGVEKLWGVGPLCRFMVEAFGECGEWFADQQALFAHLEQQNLSKSVVLIKGSRAAQMENVIHQLEEKVRYN